MKKTLLLTLLGFGITATAQVKVGSNPTTINTATTNFQVEGTATTNQFVVLKNGNVGIGTTAPNAALQLGNVATNRRIVLWETANNDNQFFGLGINAGSLRSQIEGASAGAHFSWFAGINATTSNELMRLNALGNLGIGTTTPAAKLDVNGTSNLRGLVSTSDVIELGSLGSGDRISLIDFHSQNGVDNNARIIRWSGANGSFEFVNSGTGNLNLVNGANSLTLTATGNVGIGTTTPAAKLDVAGQVKISGGSPGAGKVLTSDAAGLASWAAPTTAGTVTAVTGTAPIAVATGTSTPVISIATANTTTTGALTSADWNTFNGKQAALISGTNIKTINSTSVLGSGNIAVEPTVTAGTTAQYYRGDKTWQTLDKTAVGLANVDNTTDLNKPISTATQTALNAKLATASNGLTATGTLVELGGTLTKATTIANAGFNLGITGTGNTGIGTATPVRKLDIFGDNANMGIIANNENQTASLFFGTNAPTGVPGGGGVTAVVKTAIIAEGAGGFNRNNLHFALSSSADNALSTVATVADAKMTILNSGNVGIGTTNPLVKFHLQRAGVGTLARFDMSDGVSGAPQLDFRTSANTNGAAFTIQTVRNSLAEDAPLALNPNGGSVGIRTTTPLEIFDVNGNVGLTNRNFKANATQLQINFRTGGNAGELAAPIAQIVAIDRLGTTGATSYDGDLAFNTVANNTVTEKMRVLYNGRVGIGTAVPSSLLSVNGSADKVGGGSWGTFSDARVKKNIQDYTKGLAEILNIRTVSFEYNGKGPYKADGKVYVGVLAQEIEKVLPSTVSIIKTEEFQDLRQYDSSELIYTLINAVKELKAEIELLKLKK